MDFKDDLCRFIDKFSYIDKVLQLFLIFLQIIVQEIFENKMPVAIFALMISLYSISCACLKTVFVNYDVFLLNFSIKFMQIWLIIVFIFSYTIKIQKVQQNLFTFVLIGYFFFIWLIIAYRFRLYEMLIGTNIKKIQDKEYFVFFLVQLLYLCKNKKKTKRNELMLASIIQYHRTTCVKVKCVCKYRENCFLPKTGQRSNIDKVSFKDKVFVLNLINELLNQGIDRLGWHGFISKFDIIFQLEELGNFHKASQKILMFEKRSKERNNIVNRLFLYQNQQKLKKVVEKTQNTKNIPYIRIENLKNIELSYLTLCNKIFDLIKSKKTFWQELNQGMIHEKQIKKICKLMIDQKKQIHKCLNYLEQNIDRNKKFCAIKSFYYNCILFQPLKNLQTDKKKRPDFIQKQTNQIIDIFDNNSFVIQSQFNFQGYNNILWVSDNSSKILKDDVQNIQQYNIEVLMPQIIAKKHEQFVINYQKRGCSEFLSNVNLLWFMDRNYKLNRCQLYSKFLTQNNQITAINYFKKLICDGIVLLDQNGKINAIGKSFYKIFDQEYEFFKNHKHIPILVFAPTLIPYFLPYFYQIDDFKIDNFKIQEFKQTFVMIFKDQTNKLIQISDLLSKQKNTQDYCKAIFQILKNTKVEHIESIYKIDFKLNKIQDQYNGGILQLWQLEIVDYELYEDWSQQDFDSQFVFLEKISFSKQIKYSLRRYQQRQFDLMQQNQQQSKSEYLSILDQSIKDKRNSVNTNQGIFVQIEGENMKKAVTIIQKLFKKKFFTQKSNQQISKPKQRWIDLINKHNQSQNKSIGILIDEQIEELPKNFSNGFYQKSTLSQPLKIKENKNNRLSCQLFNLKETSSKNERLQMHQQQLLQQQITKNKNKNIRKILIIVILFLFTIILQFCFHVYIKQKFVFEQKKSIDSKGYTQSISDYNNLITQIFYFDNHLYQKSCRLFDCDKNKFLQIYKQRQNDYINFTKNSNLDMQFLNQQSNWKTGNGNIFLSLIIFFKLVISQNYSYNIDNQQNYELLKENWIQVIQQIRKNKKFTEDNFIKNYNTIRKQSQIYAGINIFVFFTLNLVILLLFFFIIKNYNQIFTLFQKIDNGDIRYYYKYYKQYYNFLLMFDSNINVQKIINFKPKKKNQKNFIQISFQQPNKKTVILKVIFQFFFFVILYIFFDKFDYDSISDRQKKFFQNSIYLNNMINLNSQQSQALYIYTQVLQRQKMKINSQKNNIKTFSLDESENFYIIENLKQIQNSIELSSQYLQNNHQYQNENRSCEYFKKIKLQEIQCEDSYIIEFQKNLSYCDTVYQQFDDINNQILLLGRQIYNFLLKQNKIQEEYIVEDFYDKLKCLFVKYQKYCKKLNLDI